MGGLFAIDKDINEDTKIWRYFSLPKFLYILDTGCLFFPTAEIMAEIDPYECNYFIHERERMFEQNIDTDDEKTINYINNIRKVIFLNSWNISDDENYSLWKIYGKDTNSIALQISVGKLKEFLSKAFRDYKDVKKIFINKIKYYNIDELKRNNHNDFQEKPAPELLNLLSRKLKHYKYEEELRIFYSPVIEDAHHTTILKRIGKTKFETNPKEFIKILNQNKLGKMESEIGIKNDSLLNYAEKIVIHPDYDPWCLSSLNNLIKKSKLITNTIKIQESVIVTKSNHCNNPLNKKIKVNTLGGEIASYRTNFSMKKRKS